MMIRTIAAADTTTATHTIATDITITATTPITTHIVIAKNGSGTRNGCDAAHARSAKNAKDESGAKTPASVSAIETSKKASRGENPGRPFGKTLLPSAMTTTRRKAVAANKKGPKATTEAQRG